MLEQDSQCRYDGSKLRKFFASCRSLAIYIRTFVTILFKPMIMNEEAETLSKKKSVSPHAGAWVLIAVAALYSIAPLDFIPDVISPYGWVDDIIIVVISLINLVQSYLKPKHEELAKVIKRIKWTMIGIAPMAIIALAIVVLCKKLF
jgi:uncharacterized membrane protein YkvA (DUF1232 family)